MVTDTNTYVMSYYIEPLRKSKYSKEVRNKFVIDTLSLNQAYFWTAIWQDGEKEADDDIKQGRVRKPKSAKDVIHRLHSKRK